MGALLLRSSTLRVLSVAPALGSALRAGSAFLAITSLYRSPGQTRGAIEKREKQKRNDGCLGARRAASLAIDTHGQRENSEAHGRTVFVFQPVHSGMRDLIRRVSRRAAAGARASGNSARGDESAFRVLAHRYARLVPVV